MIRDVDELTDAWENIEDSNSFCILSILLEMCKKPYASLSLLLMFRYFHIAGVGFKLRDIELIRLGDNIYNIAGNSDKIYPIAREFNYLLRDNPARNKYFPFIDRFSDFCNDPKLPNLNYGKIMNAIREGDVSSFSTAQKRNKMFWPQFATLRKPVPPDQNSLTMLPISQRKQFELDLQEQGEVKNNPKVKKSGFTKWKPLHFMIYYDQTKMVSNLLKVAKYSQRKVISIENKKLKIGDDCYPLLMCIR